MKAEASRIASRLTLLGAAAALIAACVEAPVASTEGDGSGTYSGASNDAAKVEHRRAFTGWNSNAVGVNVISGPGRPQLR